MDPINRRGFISRAAATGGLYAAGSFAGAWASPLPGEETLSELLAQPTFVEKQAGDPPEEGGNYETLTLNSPFQQKAVGDDPVFPKKDGAKLARRMLEITSQFVADGVGRTNKVSQVIEILAVNEKPLKEDGTYVAYCAAGIAYAACRAYCDVFKAEPYDAQVNGKRVDQFKSKITTISAH